MKKQMVVLALAALLVSSGAFARYYYGALAIDVKTGATGIAMDYNSEEQANNAALLDCKRESKGKKSNCIVASSFWNSCAAIAWSAQQKSAKKGWADSSMDSAANEAMYRCKKLDKAEDCKITARVCTSWETEEVIWW